MEAKSNNIHSPEIVSSGDITQELAAATESIERVELDLACVSEKLVNLDLLVMCVTSKEIDFEDLDLEEDHILEDSIEKAFEFDLLYGFLNAEIRELHSFLSDLQTDVVTSHKIVCSCKKLGRYFAGTDEKLKFCQESLKRSFEQLADIKLQSTKFETVLLTFSGETMWQYEKEVPGVQNGDLSNTKTQFRMLTFEQQRHVLKMLEKSLAQEMDLEMKLSESRQTEEHLRFRLQQEVLSMEEEADIVWGRLIEAEIMWGVSKELFQLIQMSRIDLNRSVQRERELRSQIRSLNVQLREKDVVLLDSEHSRNKLVEKVNELEQKLIDFQSQVLAGENKGLPSKIREQENTSDESEEKFIEAEK